MQIFVNGVEQQHQAGLRLADLLRSLNHAEGSVAVAVNRSFVPRNNYHDHVLNEADEIEIVAPMQGG